MSGRPPRHGREGRRRVAVVAVGVILLVCAAVSLAAGRAKPQPWPPPLGPESEWIDEIRVDKSERLMELWRDGRLVRRYRIALGDAPVGHKFMQGDERTPEGRYRIEYRNGRSRFHLSLRVSYPDAEDRARARASGVDPGGDIMIHGGTPAGYHRDWTDGCIAVSNAEIEEIWRLVPVGTPIVIVP